MKNKLAIYILAIILLTIGVFFCFHYIKKQASPHQKCPDEYGTDDKGSAEHLQATNKWTNDFFDAHPGATLSDWSKARYQFWVDNNCSKALHRYQEAKDGKANPAEVNLIDDVLKKYKTGN